MRVLYVHSGNLYGGVETLQVTLARHRDLCPAMEPSYALCFKGRLSEELIATGVPVYLLNAVRVSRPLTVLRARRQLGDLLQREHFDLVVCHSTWSQALFGPVARSHRLPLVFWLHNPTDGQHWLDRWGRRTIPDLALCNSRFTAKMLPNLYPTVRTEVIYCPVAPAERGHSNGGRVAERAKERTPEDATVIIQVSRMEAWKGHALLLEALSLLNDLPNWVCWQVGGGQRPEEVQYLEELKKTALRLGIGERIRFLDQRPDVTKLLAAADIHCQANTGPEPFGLTFIEALAARLPVVTTAIGGALEIVNETCGLLVPPDDPLALAEALRRLIQDRSLREKLGNAAPLRARELCDAKTQMQRLLECFSRVCRRPAQVSPVSSQTRIGARRE